MADLNNLIAQLAAADELSEALGADEPIFIGELQAAIRDATICAYRLRLARELTSGRISAVEEG